MGTPKVRGMIAQTFKQIAKGQFTYFGAPGIANHATDSYICSEYNDCCDMMVLQKTACINSNPYKDATCVWIAEAMTDFCTKRKTLLIVYLSPGGAPRDKVSGRSTSRCLLYSPYEGA